MKRVMAEVVKKQYNEWQGFYEENNRRGRDAILFYLGEQWDQPQVTNRANTNKESMIFNLAAKHIKRSSAQLMETEFSINLAPANEDAMEKPQESNAFRKVLQTIMLSNDNIAKITQGGDKCIKFGYSFYEVNFQRENEKSLCTIPTVRLHTDPSIAFWDKNATHPSRVDGRFCGMCKKATKEEIMEKLGYLGKRKLEKIVNEDDNEVFYYWYRDYRKCKVKLLTNGQYVRDDFITEKDELETLEGARFIFESLCEEDKIAQGNKPSPIEKEDEVCCIYFQIFINDKEAMDPKLFPTNDLPLVYHFGFTEWDGNREMRTIPLVEFLKDPNRLHNFVNSQIATMAKNSSSDKWFFTDDHILTPTQEQDAKDINTLEGGFHFGGDPATIRRERSAELPMSLMQMGQISKQEMDEIGGAMMDAQQSDATIVSGVAIDKITHNIGLLNLSFLGNHILVVKTIARLWRQMIPRLITEERTIISKNKDGSGEAIIVNKYLGTGDIQNNIKDINNNFDYDLDVGPNTQAQRENARKAMGDFIQANPQAIQYIGDVYWRNVDSPDSGELERRISAMMDQSLIAYGRGEISIQDFQKQQQQQQQQQMQQQMMMNKMQQQPEIEAAHAAAKAENEKANAMKMEAMTKRAAVIAEEQTKRMKILEDAKNNMSKIMVQIAELKQKGSIEQGNQALEMIEKHLKATQQMIDAREVEIAAKKSD